MRGANLPDSQAMAQAINRRNARIHQQAEEAVGLIWRVIVLVFVGVIGGYFLAEYFTPCASAAHLCMGVAAFRPRLSALDVAQEASVLQGSVHRAIEAARAAGEMDGHRLGFIEGTRRGIVVGACWGLVAGVLLIVGAVKAGWLVGYL